MSDLEISIEVDNKFAQIPHWVLEQGLSSAAIHLYVTLIKFANWDSKEGYPSRSRLAKYMGVSIKTVDRAKDELVENKVLEFKRRFNDNIPTSNLYRVITANPKGVATNLLHPSDKNDPRGSDKNDILTRTIINDNQLTKKKEVEQSSPEIFEICFYLAKAIENRGLRPRPREDWITGQNWLSETRLLLEGKIGKGDTKEDSGRLSTAQIKAAIDYAMNDSFWATNILSPAKLRKQYPMLRMQATAAKEKRQPKGLSAIMQIREEESRKVAQNALN